MSRKGIPVTSNSFALSRSMLKKSRSTVHKRNSAFALKVTCDDARLSFGVFVGPFDPGEPDDQKLGNAQQHPIKFAALRPNSSSSYVIRDTPTQMVARAAHSNLRTNDSGQ
jgi:hypothetical protein